MKMIFQIMKMDEVTSREGKLKKRTGLRAMPQGTVTFKGQVEEKRLTKESEMEKEEKAQERMMS